MTTPILPLTLQAAGYAPNGVALLTDISLTLYAGQRLVILGANGAGKSLLLRLCHGLIDPTSGARLWANGQLAINTNAATAPSTVFDDDVLAQIARHGLGNDATGLV